MSNFASNCSKIKPFKARVKGVVAPSPLKGPLAYYRITLSLNCGAGAELATKNPVLSIGNNRIRNLVEKRWMWYISENCQFGCSWKCSPWRSGFVCTFLESDDVGFLKVFEKLGLVLNFFWIVYMWNIVNFFYFKLFEVHVFQKKVIWPFSGFRAQFECWEKSENWLVKLNWENRNFFS